jgi:hypothetical protein
MAPTRHRDRAALGTPGAGARLFWGRGARRRGRSARHGQGAAVAPVHRYYLE